VTRPSKPAAAERWAEQLAGWAVPEHVLDQAPESPWTHDIRRFAVDVTVDRDSLSARSAREVLPARGGTVLDVGCGGGRASLALVPPASELVGVDTSGAMLDEFLSACARAGVARRTIHGRWPDVAPITPVADLVVCHHVLYNVAGVEPFLLALTEHARLAVVVELPPEHPMSAWAPAWKHFWGIERPTSPTADDLIAVIAELGLEPEHAVSSRPPLPTFAADPANLVPTARRRLCLSSDRDDELATWLATNPPQWSDTVVTIRWPGGD
jgi:SAM-dependent methyltransferase